MRLPRFAIAVPVSLALSLGFAAGCGNKGEECKAIVDTIDDDDAALKAVDLNVTDFKVLSVNLKTAADAVEKVATDLAAKKLTNAELSKESSEYQAFAKDLAKELREFGVLVGQLGETLDKLSPIAKTFSSGIHKLQARCKGDSGAAKDCIAIGKAMGHAPDQDAFMFDKDLKEDADAFAKFVTELKAVEVTDKEAKADFEEVIKAIGMLEQFMRSMVELKPKFDANRAALIATIAKEGPIERHISETCAGK